MEKFEQEDYSVEALQTINFVNKGPRFVTPAVTPAVTPDEFSICCVSV